MNVYNESNLNIHIYIFLARQFKSSLIQPFWLRPYLSARNASPKGRHHRRCIITTHPPTQHRLPESNDAMCPVSFDLIPGDPIGGDSHNSASGASRMPSPKRAGYYYFSYVSGNWKFPYQPVLGGPAQELASRPPPGLVQDH